jgi:hypothetical protein
MMMLADHLIEMNERFVLKVLKLSIIVLVQLLIMPDLNKALQWIYLGTGKTEIHYIL